MKTVINKGKHFNAVRLLIWPTAKARQHFKKRLNGIINVRTDGTVLYAYRRIPTSDQFVTYGPMSLDTRTPSNGA